MIPEGAIVEWHEQPSNITTGIVANVPPVRRLGRLNHYRDGLAVIYDADGIRCVVDPARLTVLTERAEAGWGRL